jgi:hypothetical protein
VYALERSNEIVYASRRAPANQRRLGARGALRRGLFRGVSVIVRLEQAYAGVIGRHCADRE